MGLSHFHRCANHRIKPITWISFLRNMLRDKSVDSSDGFKPMIPSSRTNHWVKSMSPMRTIPSCKFRTTRWKRGEDDRPCERTGTNEYSYLLCATGFSTKGNTIGGISPSGYKHTLSRGKCGEETLPSFLDASFKRSRLLTDRIETIHADGVTGKYLIYNGEWIILRLSHKSARYFTCLAYVPL